MYIVNLKHIYCLIIYCYHYYYLKLVGALKTHSSMCCSELGVKRVM